MKYLFVINPISGGIDKTSIIKTIKSSFATGFLFFYTTGYGDKEALMKEIEKFQPNIIIAVGGDGTILFCSEVIMKLPTKPLLGILPTGSANGMAKELHIPDNYVEAIDIIKKRENESSLDLIQINKDIYCLHIGDAGLNARIVRDYTEDGQRGYFTYAKYFFEEVKKAETFISTIVADGKEYQFEGYMLAVSNAMHYGTGVKVNSISNPSDGKFELSCMSDIGFGTFLRAGLSALDIDFVNEEKEQIISCEKAKITFNRPVTFQVDGEMIGEVSGFEAEIIKSAVTVITKKVL
jgi:diacylglycerol kinase (ATP)